MTHAAPERLPLRVHALRRIAENIIELDLRGEGRAPAPIEAGAHLDLHLPGGLTRSYSLTNPGDASGRYVLAVALDAASRGGSAYIHARLRPGDTLQASGPRNHFPLAPGAAPSLLIAGGIGITPIWAMIQRLAAEQRDWRLLYAVRSRARAAYLDILLQRYPDRLSLHVNEEAGGAADLAGFLRTAPADAQLYCCGPTPMLDAFESATADRQPSQVHLERFKGSGDVAAGGFTVIAAASGGSHFVAEGSTILDTLLDAGLDIPHSCADGICGTCATRVIEGIPDHRDTLLSAAEREANKKMLICVSGCKGSRLVLDL